MQRISLALSALISINQSMNLYSAEAQRF